MGRAYSIRPYTMRDFQAMFDHNLGPSSHPFNPGSNHNTRAPLSVWLIWVTIVTKRIFEKYFVPTGVWDVEI